MKEEENPLTPIIGHEIIESLKRHIVSPHKVYAVLLFFTERELGISEVPGRWVCTGVHYFENGTAALNFYANTRCPASQLVDAETKEELEREINQMKENYKDQKWLDENLYPYI